MKKIIAAILAVAVAVSLCGCAELSNFFNNIEEKLVGKDFNITQYDHFGNETMKIHGDSVSVGLFENDSNLDVESTGFESKVLELTIDGNQVFTVGDTLIIAEDGLDMVTDFSDSGLNIDVSDGMLSWMVGDRLVNKFRNSIGKDMTVIVKSQLGIPICIYQGNDVYATVPDNLPDTTQLTIDDKQLYIYRADYTILESDMIDAS